MTWRCSYEAALRPVETAVSSNGPYLVGQGAVASMCTHEASHATVMISTGARIERIEVALDFERTYGGSVYARVRGRAKYKMGEPSTPASSSDFPPRRGGKPIACWMAIWKDALVTAAGPAGEMKFRAQAGLSRGAIGATDSEPMSQAGRLIWNCCGRDGIAFQRLVWRDACRLMDVPLIWKAIAAVEGELFSGLLRLEPADPRPGDSIEFVMPGSRAEELMAAAGIVLPNILAPHQCGPECIRPSRRTSRRWQEYLAEWAKELKDAA